VTNTVIQDIKITTDNVIYHRETWYSPSLNNQDAIDLLTGFKLSAIICQKVNDTLQKNQIINEASIEAMLDDIKAGPRQRTRI